MKQLKNVVAASKGSLQDDTWSSTYQWLESHSNAGRLRSLYLALLLWSKRWAEREAARKQSSGRHDWSERRVHLPHLWSHWWRLVWVGGGRCPLPYTGAEVPVGQQEAVTVTVLVRRHEE